MRRVGAGFLTAHESIDAVFRTSEGWGFDFLSNVLIARVVKIRPQFQAEAVSLLDFRNRCPWRVGMRGDDLIDRLLRGGTVILHSNDGFFAKCSGCQRC
jgi:hypothetical protein